MRDAMIVQGGFLPESTCKNDHANARDFQCRDCNGSRRSARIMRDKLPKFLAWCADSSASNEFDRNLTRGTEIEVSNLNVEPSGRQFQYCKLLRLYHSELSR